MKKLCILLMLCAYFCAKAQIKSGIFGQNAQLTYVVGVVTETGKLDQFWDKYGINYPASQNYIGDAKIQFMRYGGNQVEADCQINGNPSTSTDPIAITIQDYINKAIAMQDNGIEPMMTLPLKLDPINIPDYATAASQAAKLVQGVNNGLIATSNTHTGGYYKPVVFWIYANEPNADNVSSPHYNDFLGTNGASNLHDFISKYYNAITAIWSSSWNSSISGTYPGPQFVGPEMIGFDNYQHYSPPGNTSGTPTLNRLVDQLTGHWNQVTNTNTNEFDITPFISVWSWHTYPFGDEGSNSNTYQPLPNRSNVISCLASGAPTPSGQPTTPLATQIGDFTTKLAGSLNPGVKLGITEANICYSDDVGGSNGADDQVTGVGANSFIAGQFWAEMMGICMDKNMDYLNFWSAIEGSSSYGNYKTNIGFLNNDPGLFGGVIGARKSTYYHFKMIAENFSGTFFSGAVTTGGGSPITDVKAFAYYDGTNVGVMILDQKQTTPSSSNTFAIDFHGSAPITADINITFNISGMATGAAYACGIRTESSVLLKFDASSGNIFERTDYSVEDNVNNVGPKTWNPANITSDAYIRDRQDDDGNEPFHLADPWNTVDGTDVWVRNVQATPLGGDRYSNEHQHENPEWKSTWNSTPSDRPYIYVMVRNRGCTQIAGTVHLYDYDLSLNDHWSTCTPFGTGGELCGSWQEILCGDNNADGELSAETPCTNPNFLTLAPGEERVIEARWNSVGDATRFPNPDPSNNCGGVEHCLLARFISNPVTDDPITAAQELNSVGAAWNGARSNNITQKNVTFINCAPGLACGPIDVQFGNVSEKQSTNKLELVDISSSFTGVNGLMTIDLGKTLYDAWAQGGKKGSGVADGRSKYDHMSSTGVLHNHSHVSPDPSPYEVALTGTTATLENISLPPKEILPIGTYLHYYPGAGSNTSYEYQFRQYESFNVNQPTYTFTGAVNLYLTHPICPVINAGPDKTIGRDCSTKLQATTIVSGANYIWRNNSTGATVGTGTAITVAPKVTTTYELEVQSPNCCTGYDVVTVNVNPQQSCRIVSCPVIDFSNKTLHQPEIIKNREVVVSGYLRVPANVTLRIESSKVNFQKDASLEIMPGGRLEIIDGELRGCNPFDRWKGISGIGNNSDNSQIKISGSSITNAVTAISAHMVSGLTIENTTIAYGTTGIELISSKNFTIHGNEFYTQDAIKTSTTLAGITSVIENNYFAGSQTAINFTNDNHSNLAIKCNTFDSYSNYAIYSSNTTLKDQGSSIAGAGNIFVSSSTQVNNQLRHSGNTMKYYYDPSVPVSLTTGGGMTAIAQAASADGLCASQGSLSSRQSVNEDGANVSGLEKYPLNCVPNPASNSATILFTLPENTLGEIRITNLVGELVSKYPVTSSSISLNIDCTSFTDGIYFYSLISNGNLLNTKKMIIAK